MRLFCRTTQSVIIIKIDFLNYLKTLNIKENEIYFLKNISKYFTFNEYYKNNLLNQMREKEEEREAENEKKKGEDKKYREDLEKMKGAEMKRKMELEGEKNKLYTEELK